jgi:hypothetical protein
MRPPPPLPAVLVPKNALQNQDGHDVVFLSKMAVPNAAP